MSDDRPARSVAEWTVFAVAAAVLLAVVAAIVLLAFRARDPAAVTVRPVGEPRIEGGTSYLTAEVHNTGDETAEAVQVVGELTVGGEVVAEGEQMVDFLAGGEVEKVVFAFDESDAKQGEVELRVASYAVP